MHVVPPSLRNLLLTLAAGGLPLVVSLTTPKAVTAQQQTVYPAPLLKAVSPPGGRAGSSVEVTLVGTDLEGATALYFSTPGLTAERLPEPPPPKDRKGPAAPLSAKFRVAIPADAPHGLHDVRVVGKWGISNPRAFAVGGLAEVAEVEPNSDVPDARRIELGSVASGVIADRTDVDYYTFAGKVGDRLVIHCAATSIDSRLTAFVQLFDSAGKELANNQRYRDGDAVLDRTLLTAGDYLIRVSDFAYQFGGPEAFYRLTVSAGPWIDAAYPPAVTIGKANTVTLYGRNLPGGKRGPRGRDDLTVQVTPPTPGASGPIDFPGRLLPRAAGVQGFGFRLPGSNPVLLAYADGPVVLEAADNDTPATAQEVPVPADICGRIEKRGDRDLYVFTAAKGDVLTIEGFADRLRSPMDLYFQLRRLDNGQIVGDYDTHPDIPPMLSRFYTHTNDPAARLVAPVDGKYELLVGSQDAAARGGVRTTYWVSLRRERPDFRLILVGNHASGAGLTLHRGSSQEVQVVCLRQDGFDGEVTLTAEGLPAGVTCPPQVLGPKLKEGGLVLTAAADAKDAAVPFRITGTAVVSGKKVVREAWSGCLVYPSANANVPAVSRLARSLCLAVRDPGPFRLTATGPDVAVPVGGTATVKVKVDRKQPDFKGNVAIELSAGPVQANGRPIPAPKMNVAPDKDGEVKIPIPANTPAGNYSLVFRGTGKLQVEETGTKRKRNADYVTVAGPVPLRVYDEACALKVSPVALRPGSEAVVPVAIERLHKYAGTFMIELVAPNGVGGLAAASVTVPAGTSSTRLVLKADKDVKPAKDLTFLVRATARIGSASLKTEQPLTVSVDAMAEPGSPTAPAANAKAVALLPEAAAGWRYAAKVSGDGWRAADFDDKGWKEVKAPLGNGEPDVASRKGTEVPEKGQPVYCRRAFDVPAELLQTKGVTFRLRVASDNSAAVYLNGKAADEDAGDHEFSYWNRDVVLPASLFKPGRNVISVRVDNTSGSSDLYLDLSVRAEVPELAKK